MVGFSGLLLRFRPSGRRCPQSVETRPKRSSKPSPELPRPFSEWPP